MHRMCASGSSRASAAFFRRVYLNESKLLSLPPHPPLSLSFSFPLFLSFYLSLLLSLSLSLLYNCR
jgi:hypothetical protein